MSAPTMSAHKRNRSILLLSLASTLLLPACAGDAAKGESAGKSDKAEPAKPATDAVAPGEVEGKPVEGEQKVAVAEGSNAAAGDKEYDLQIEPPSATVGAEGKVSIKLVPRGNWHLNMDFPTSLSVEPPAGVTVGKPKLKKDDAVKFEEAGAEFAVAFTASDAGDKTFTGEFKFAVCEEDSCVPKTEKLQFVVAVK